MAGAKCLLKTPSNFQSTAMFEGSECVQEEEEGGSTGSTVASSISACKKVLCSNSVLDSSDYWLKNDKTLCRLGLLDDDTEGSCTTICFVNFDPQKTDCRNDKIFKKLASVSPDLPKLVELLTVHQPRENEILLFGGLEASDSCQTHPHSRPQRSTGVCLVQCWGKRQTIQPGGIIFEINKFLIGLQWGREHQHQHQQGGAAGQRLEDDTNRSISSIEEDFTTASEHLGDDSEDDGFRNESQSGDLADILVEMAQKHCVKRTCQRGQVAQPQGREDVDVKRESQQLLSYQVKESAGHYATNLAESVLQDAFIRLSQDENSFVSEVAVSVSPTSPPSHFPDSSKTKQRTCSFELPKIVIVQSPDISDGGTEWPETQLSHVPNQGTLAEVRELPEKDTKAYIPHTSTSKHVEVALACAASVIGTITTPQLTEKLTMDSASEEEEETEEEEEQGPGEKDDFSFSSALCSMAQVASVVAAMDIKSELVEGKNSGLSESFTAGQGLLSAAEASAAFTLHCSITEGTSVEAFHTNIAEVLHREVVEVLTQPQGYKSVAHLLEVTHNKIVDGIRSPKKTCAEGQDTDEFLDEVAESLFKHALQKVKRNNRVQDHGTDALSLQSGLQNSINNLLFEILCLTQKKISHISNNDQRSFETQEDDNCAATKENRHPFIRLQCLTDYSQSTKTENHSDSLHCTDKLAKVPGLRDKCMVLEGDFTASFFAARNKEQQQQTSVRLNQSMDFSDHQQVQQGNSATREPLSEMRGRLITAGNSRQSSLTPQSSLSACNSLMSSIMDSESRTPITCYADDLATTVVSMATELAAICLENSSGKQPWFCALKGATTEGVEGYLIPACRRVFRRKESQGNNTASKKHRAPRLSEIKKKTEEQPELMERLVNRVVDDSVNLDEPQDPFALFASEVSARIMNCPELNVVDTSKAGQPRSRLQCDRWSRGKASSYESIPEEDTDSSGFQSTLGPNSRLGQNLSRGSSISKQSSCESITDEFSQFMVNQMETEGRGFDLLLDYYAGKNASNILTAAVQQAASKKNGHLNVRASACLSKQSSTESITEEFYRFMLRDMDKENKDFGITRTKEWSNSLFPPSPRTPFCIRQSSVPDRRSSDSRLSVSSPVKANSFDGFARNVHGDTLSIYPTPSVSFLGLCKSDSCLYQKGKTDQITDMLIHDTWTNSIESLMRKNKIIAEPEDSVDLEAHGESQPHVQLFANRLAADIVDVGRSALGAQQDVAGGLPVSHPLPVGERRRGFKQSHHSCTQSRTSQEQAGPSVGSSGHDVNATYTRGPRDVPLIHIEGDQKDEENVLNQERSKGRLQQRPGDVSTSKHTERAAPKQNRTGNSSASSLGMADLDTFYDVPTQGTVISKETQEGRLTGAKENIFESSCVRAAGSGGNLTELLVINCDLESKCLDSELSVALQWIAASELGFPVLCLMKSKETKAEKFQRVVHLMSQRSWRVADLFRAVLQFCQLQEEEEVKGLFDWLLETLLT
uniref:SPHK1 interactor, AKAP domain containing n=1 Tax=Cynoglossus semilaevis TaxID=244447 RepID=A0A3P8UK38_CYNSE